MTEYLPQVLIATAAGAPLAAGLVTTCWGRCLSPAGLHRPACAGALLSLAAGIASIGLLFSVPALLDEPLTVYRWVSVPGSAAPIFLRLQIDALSALFLVVTGVAALVAIYHAVSTIRGDSDRRVWLACASFLQFATVALLLAGDWFTFFFVWQLSAFVMYFLRARPTDDGPLRVAALDRFLIARTADAAMLFGLLLLGSELGSFDFAHAAGSADTPPSAAALRAVGFCLFAAVVARCGLFPLMARRDDAAGCCTADAMIESALFAPVGIYLLARADGLTAASPAVQAAVVGAGGLSAIAGAIGAAAHSETRQRLRASGSSLFGLAVLGLGTGTSIGSAAALLLVSVQTVSMTGLWSSVTSPKRSGERSPQLRWAFAASAAVLCSGVWGQHAILKSVADAIPRATDPILGRTLLAAYWCGIASLPLLSFAMTREWLSFASRSGKANVSAWPLWLPPIAAAVLPALLFGFPEQIDMLNAFRHADEGAVRLASLLTVDVGLPLVLLGAVAAWLSASLSPTPFSNQLTKWLQLGSGLEELRMLAVVLPVRAGARACRFVDRHLLDVVWISLPNKLLAAPARVAGALQTGQVQFYLLSILLATALLLLVLTGLQG